MELGREDIRLEILVESLPENLLVELHRVVSNPGCWRPSFCQLDDTLRKLEERGQRRVGDLRGHHARQGQRLRSRDDVGRKATAQVDALNLGEVFVGPDRRELQGLIKLG